MTYDVLVIGAGPAGMTAAIYAKRAGMRVGMLEKGAPGGQMVNTHEVENYTGFAKIGGPELSLEMFNHTQMQGVEYVYGNVVDIIDGDIKTIRCEDTEYKAKSVIIASGTVNKTLGVPGEEKFKSRGISWCAICDGAFYRDMPVAVIGGGNSAIEEATYLTSICSKVYVIHRRDTFRADKAAQDRAFANEKMEFILNSEVLEFMGENQLEGIKVRNTETGEVKEIKVNAAFEYVGQNPCTHMVANLNITNQLGYIPVDHDMNTAVKGIFAAGDVTEKHLRQIATAVSDGAIAGQEAAKYVNSKR